MKKNTTKKNSSYLKFRAVNVSDAEILYDLLNNRNFNISNLDKPAYEDHIKFIENNPYLHWYLIYTNIPVGTFYIQRDNSIGINIENQSDNHVAQIINFIKNNFLPQKSLASVIPSCFHINTPVSNINMIKSLEKNNLTAIQITHKFSDNGN
jgi:hypothetical protein